MFIKQFKLILAVILASSVAFANTCRSIFLQDVGPAKIWHEVEQNSQAQALIGGVEINAFVRTAIESAKQSIEIQSLKLSEQIADLLIKKSQQGVKVHIQITDVMQINTSADRREASLVVLKKLQDAGVVVDQYDAASLKRHTKIPSPDMHKKLLVVDNEYAYVGNKNFNQYQESLEFGVGLRGEVAAQLRSGFYKDLMHSQKSVDYLHEVLEAANSSQIKIYGTHQLKENILSLIQTAKKSITLAQIEFNDPVVVEKLIQTKRLNPSLNIQIITASMTKTYEVGPWHFKRPYNVDVVQKLTDAGIAVHEFQSGGTAASFFHGKITILDSEKVIVGSSDYNRRSLEGNAELDIQITAPLLAKEFESFIVQNKTAKTYQGQFTKSELRTAKYYKLLTELLIKVNQVKRLTVDKVRLSPQNLKLMIQRNMGVLLRWLSPFGVSVVSKPITRLSEVTEALGDRVITVRHLLKEAPLKEGESLVFLGSTPYYAETSLQWGLQKTQNGRYGDGFYLARHFDAAVDYSQYRISQTSKKDQDLHVMVFKVKDLKLDSDSGSADGFIVPAALGYGQDYLVLKSSEKLEPFALLKIKNPAK